MAQRTQTSFLVDAATDKVLDDLKVTFGVTTKAQVIRKALALSKVVARSTNEEDHTVTIKDSKGQEQIILLQG